MRFSKTWILLGVSTLIAQSSDSGTGSTGNNAVGQATGGSTGSGSTNSGTNSGGDTGSNSGNSNGGNNSSGNSSDGNDNQASNNGNSSGNNSNNFSGDSNQQSGNSSNNDKSGNNSNNDSKDDSKNDSKDDSKNNSKSKDPNDTLASAIRVTEPIYLETAKKASISINRAVMFKWEYTGRKAAEPGSISMTLEEDRGYKVAYRIADDISGSDKKFLWDIPNYRPSDNDTESIVLKPGNTYKMYIHDSNTKYNAIYVKGGYKPGVREFSLFASSDPSNPFGAASPTASLSLPLTLLTSFVGFTYLYL